MAKIYLDVDPVRWEKRLTDLQTTRDRVLAKIADDPGSRHTHDWRTKLHDLENAIARIEAAKAMVAFATKRPGDIRVMPGAAR